MKTLIRIVLGILLLGMAAISIWVGPYALQVQHFQAEPTLGYQADFYMYISPKAQRLAKEGKEVTILVQPNNSGTNSDDPKIHQQDAWMTGFERKATADDLGVVLLVPAFIRPGEDWFLYTHALDRDTLMTERPDLKRIDLQLIAMIDHARLILEQSGINTDERVFIQGFSASAMFANRFTILHPDRVKAAAIGSPGGFPILPVESYQGKPMLYPAGVADLEELTGTPFDAETYNAIPQLIYMGDQDDNDSLDFTDGWDEEQAAVIDRLFGADPFSRWDAVKTVYKEEGSLAEFVLFEEVGHDRKALQEYSVDFFRKILNYR